MSAITNQRAGSKSWGLESIKWYEFDGEEKDKWNEYSIKALIFEEMKGWMNGLTDGNASNEKKNKGKSYLTMPLTDWKFKFLNQSKHTKDIWEALEEELAPTEEDDRYELEEEFKRCPM